MASKRGADFTGKFAGGIVSDFKRRWAVYKSDWVDGFKAPTKCLSATLFMYFACLGPAIAFGGLAYKETDGHVGAMEYLCSQALSGIIWAVFSGQPEIVLRPAGPQTVFLIELFKRCKACHASGHCEQDISGALRASDTSTSVTSVTRT